MASFLDRYLCRCRVSRCSRDRLSGVAHSCPCDIVRVAVRAGWECNDGHARTGRLVRSYSKHTPGIESLAREEPNQSVGTRALEIKVRIDVQAQASPAARCRSSYLLRRPPPPGQRPYLILDRARDGRTSKRVRARVGGSAGDRTWCASGAGDGSCSRSERHGRASCDHQKCAHTGLAIVAPKEIRAHSIVCTAAGPFAHNAATLTDHPAAAESPPRYPLSCHTSARRGSFRSIDFTPAPAADASSDTGASSATSAKLGFVSHRSNYDTEENTIPATTRATHPRGRDRPRCSCATTSRCRLDRRGDADGQRVGSVDLHQSRAYRGRSAHRNTSPASRD